MANAFEQPNKNPSIDRLRHTSDVYDQGVYRELKKKVNDARELSKVIKNGSTIIRKLGDAGEIYEVTINEAGETTEIKEEDGRGNLKNIFGSFDQHPEAQSQQMQAAKIEVAEKHNRKYSN
jgi:hypothetical protein